MVVKIMSTSATTTDQEITSTTNTLEVSIPCWNKYFLIYFYQDKKKKRKKRKKKKKQQLLQNKNIEDDLGDFKCWKCHESSYDGKLTHYIQR